MKESVAEGPVKVGLHKALQPQSGRDFSKLLKAKMTIFDVIYIILCIYMFFET